MEVRPERTGWRDERISLRHRAWGFDTPALDLDFLLLEYDRGKACALVEFKHELAKELRRGHPSMRALSDLATRAGIPAFVAHYADDFSVYRVVPLNEQARIWIPTEQRMSEEEWVGLLYRLRGRTLPKDCAAFC